jgi:hypothetical protein
MNYSNIKPWYKKTEITVALIGIIFPFIITYIINSFDKDKKELSITYSQLEPIISESNEIINSLIINYDSVNVKNISKLNVKLKNTGNVSLTKNDFSDGPIKINIKYLNETKNIILQAREKENAGQQNSTLNYKNITNNHSEIIYYPSLLNTNDEVILEVYFLNTPNIKILSKGKILNGNITGPIPMEVRETKIGYKTFVLSLNSFFNNKWITIFLLIIFFFFVALSTIFQFSMSKEPGQKDAKGLLFMMGIVTALLSLFSITMIVSILLII